jgi:L-lactate dehydrogenase complex protein LldG
MSGQARENILGKIRKALSENAVEMPFPEAEKTTDFFVKEELTAEEKFAKEFTLLGGKFVYCANEAELLEHLQALADTMKWPIIHSKDSYLIHLFSEKNIELVQDARSKDGQENDMHDIAVGLSLCECLVARTGSVILSSGQEHGRSLPVYAPIHIAVAFTNQVVWNISDSIQLMQKKYQGKIPSMISLTTGPSRTADIEKTLVVGVHGPKEVYVFLVENE